jgi:WD40 repeat protein
MEDYLTKSLLNIEETRVKDLSVLYSNRKVIEKVKYEDILEEEVRNLNKDETREEYSLIGHTDVVIIVAFSPNGRHLASGSIDKTIKMWNLVEKKNEYSLIGHKDTVRSIAFSPDGNYLASSSIDKTVRIWNLQKRLEEYSFIDHKDEVSSVSFSPDGKYLASGSLDKTIRIWNLTERSEEYLLTDNTSQVLCVVFSPDGNFLAYGSKSQTVRVWNLAEKQQQHSFNGHNDEVLSVKYSPDGNYLASASKDKTIKIWNLQENQEEYSLIGHNFQVLSIGFSPNGKYLASCSYDKTIKIWNLEERLEEYALTGHTDAVRSLEFSPDGNYLASGSQDKTIKIWNLAEKQEDYSPIDNSYEPLSIAFSPDGRYLASGSKGKTIGKGLRQKTIRIWNLIEKREEYSLAGHNNTVSCVKFSPDGRYLASASHDRTIKFWNLEKNQEEYSLIGHKDIVKTIAFSPNGKYFASGSHDKTIKLWNLPAKKEEFSFTGHKDIIRTVAFCPRGNYIASGSIDKMIKVWDLAKKEEYFTFIGHANTVSCVTFSPDGCYLASGSIDRTVKIWNISEKREYFTFINDLSQISSVSFSPDGSYLAAGCNPIKIWNFKEKREEYSLSRHSSYALTVEFSPDGKYLATGLRNLIVEYKDNLISKLRDKTIKIWNLSKDYQEQSILNKGFIDNTNIPLSSIRRTQDERYQLYYENQNLKLFVHLGFTSMHIKSCFIAPNTILDPYYNNRSLFYAFIDGLKSKRFNKIPASTNNLLLSKYSYSSIHVLCYFNQPETLKKFLNSNCIIKADIFGKSPLYYCIKKKFQECTECLLMFLISLLSSEYVIESVKIQNSFYAIRNDFKLLIENPPILLTQFLEKLLLSSDIIFYKIENNFPIIKYSNYLMPNIKEFITDTKVFDEMPIIIQTSILQVENSLNSKKTIELVKAITKCRDKSIFGTPFIQYYIKLQWEKLMKWIAFYLMMVFFNMGFFFMASTLRELKVYALVLFSITNSILIIWEILQIKIQKWSYFSNTSNLLDFPRIIMTIGWIILEFTNTCLENYEFKIVYLIIALLTIIRSFTGFSLFDKTRYYNRLISMALKDIIYFVIIFSYTTLGFGLLFFISKSERSYNDLWQNAFALNFGNSDLGSELSEERSLEYIIFGLATIVNVILMLNLLISILGDSYDRFQMSQVQFDYEERAELILEVLEIRSIFYPMVDFIEGQYLHVCMSSYQNVIGLNENWEGKVKYNDLKLDKNTQFLKENIQNMMKKNLDSVKSLDSIKKKVDCIEGNMEKLKNQVEVNLKEKVNGIEIKVNSIDEKLESIVRLLSNQH